jgi:hypothetical protein
MAVLSTSMSMSSISGNSSSWMRCTISRHMRARVEDVGLVDAVHAAAALCARREGLAGDALDFVLAVLERVVRRADRAVPLAPAPSFVVEALATPK